ncbi:uncharacterized protein EV422DRAFT_329958 [Fimicolochytrium jonesii]|uniref:uncharacterized protein n=1 Tax=Fimicolochytrium jonesii TaxID=1396493 RepID=UPI0022FEE110|nr:uncharacterized protein EV422DRAFT_329958 [Fimicolochytrium jonesii]KAI8816191.1 hypothetical protein EV422DRAFT_329958 [Fimicolochytrium jonesii]
MRVISEQAVKGPLDDESVRVVELLSSYDISDPHVGYTVYMLLLRLSDTCPNAFRHLDSHDWLDRLTSEVTSTPSRRNQQLAAQLLCKICDTRELSIGDLKIFDAPWLEQLAELIEETREFEEQNADLLKLLLTVQYQYALKNTARSVVPNPVLLTIEKRIDHSKTLSENVIFLFNRAEEKLLRLKILRFLDAVLSDPTTSGLFYTNDLGVLLDVVVRETKNVDAEDEDLHQRYIYLLPLLLNHPGAQWTDRNREEVQKLLTGIRDGPFVRSQTRKCAEKALTGKTRRDSE